MLLGLAFLAANTLLCSGLPLSYDDDADLIGVALNASLSRVNVQSYSRTLFRVVTSYVRSVDFVDEDTYTVLLDFSIRQTDCAKDSGRDPTLCEFQWGRNVQVASCKSWVEVSEEEVQQVDVNCQHGDSSSESSSSEEMFRGRMGLNSGRNNGHFVSRPYEQTFPAGKRSRLSQKPQKRPQPQMSNNFE